MNSDWTDIVALYDDVIDELIKDFREVFVGEGFGDDDLLLLKECWKQKLEENQVESLFSRYSTDDNLGVQRKCRDKPTKLKTTSTRKKLPGKRSFPVFKVSSKPYWRFKAAIPNILAEKTFAPPNLTNQTKKASNRKNKPTPKDRRHQPNQRKIGGFTKKTTNPITSNLDMPILEDVCPHPAKYSAKANKIIKSKKSNANKVQQKLSSEQPKTKNRDLKAATIELSPQNQKTDKPKKLNISEKHPRKRSKPATTDFEQVQIESKRYSTENPRRGRPKAIHTESKANGQNKTPEILENRDRKHLRTQKNYFEAVQIETQEPCVKEQSINQLQQTKGKIKLKRHSFQAPKERSLKQVRDADSDNTLNHETSSNSSDSSQQQKAICLTLYNSSKGHSTWKTTLYTNWLPRGVVLEKSASTNTPKTEHSVENNEATVPLETTEVEIILPRHPNMAKEERLCKIQVPVLYKLKIPLLLIPAIHKVHRLKMPEAGVVLQEYVNDIFYNCITQCDGPADRKSLRFPIIPKFKGIPVAISEKRLSDAFEMDSSDDVTDEENLYNSNVFDSENIIVCQCEKVTKAQGKWKIMLNNGVMHLNGKDYAFQAADGFVYWTW